MAKQSMGGEVDPVKSDDGKAIVLCTSQRYTGTRTIDHLDVWLSISDARKLRTKLARLTKTTGAAGHRRPEGDTK